MRKVTAIIRPMLVCTALFTGCGESFAGKNQGQPVTVYSFSGENEAFSVANGVMVLEAGNGICYGGNLKVSPN